jgi:Kdo2-lipid IVA lauroyltransferase/acyltransferase
MSYGLMWVLTRFLALLPEGLLDMACRGLSYFAFDVLRLRRKLILENIAIAYPSLSMAEKIEMGRTSLYHFAVTTLETLLGSVRDFTAGITVKDVRALDDAFKSGGGMYLLCIHSGNFEALGSFVSRKWASVTVPVKHVGHGGVDRFVHAQRLKYQIEPIRSKIKGDAFRAIIKAIDEGRPVGFVIDQSRPGQPRIPLFGKPAKTSTSTAGIWRKKPAALIPLHIKRLGFNRHEVTSLAPLKLELSNDLAADLLVHAKQMNEAVESLIRLAPDQYWWIHNRWK